MAFSDGFFVKLTGLNLIPIAAVVKLFGVSPER
jgi:hypothetical protein